MTDKINECQEFPKKYFALSYLFTSYSSFIIHFFNRNRTFFEYLMYIKRKNIPFFIFKFHIIIRNQQTSRWLDPRKKSIKISPPRIQLDRLKSAHSNCKKNIICRIFMELGARSCTYVHTSYLQLKGNCRLKANCNMLVKYYQHHTTIHFQWQFTCTTCMMQGAGLCLLLKSNMQSFFFTLSTQTSHRWLFISGELKNFCM